MELSATSLPLTCCVLYRFFSSFCKAYSKKRHYVVEEKAAKIIVVNALKIQCVKDFID